MLAAFGVVAALQLLGLLLPAGPLRIAAFDILGIPAGALACAACVGASRRASGSGRWAWRLLALSTAAYTLGAVLWAYDELVRGIPAPLSGWSNLAYLPAIPLAAVGVLTLLLAAGAGRLAAVGVLFDGAVVSGVLFILAWPSLAPEDGGAVEAAMAAAATYGYCTLALMMMALIGWRRTTASRDATLLGLAFAFGSMSLAGLVGVDAIVRGGYASDGWYNAGWPIGMLLLGAAAVLDRGTPKSFRLAVGFERALPLGSLLLGIVGTHGLEGSPYENVAEALLFSLVAVVVLRQTIDVREHTTLLRERDALARAAAAERDALSEAEHFAGLGSWRLDLRSEKLTWSAGLFALAGRDPKLGTPTRDEVASILGKDLLDSLRAAIPDLQKGKPFLSGDQRMTLADGRTRWVNAHARMSEEPGVLLGTVLDVTARRETEEALRRNERLASLGTLVEGVAHEINNPLTYIRGSVELIQMEAQERDLPEVAANAERALTGLARIAHISKSLDAFTHRGLGAPRRTGVHTLVTGAIARARATLHGREVRQELHASGDVLANEEELTDLLVHLAVNADEAMEGRPGAVTYRTREEPGAFVIEVQDEGRGIRPEDVPRIFTPFFTTKAEGTGLALSLGRSMVQNHGGDMTFRTRLGHGTTFVIRLPRATHAA